MTERGNLFWCVLFAGSARCAHCAVSVWLSLNFILFSCCCCLCCCCMCVCVRVFLGVFYARVPHLSNGENAVENKREEDEQSENS